MTKHFTWPKFLIYFFLIIFGILMIFPFYWMFITSVKTPIQLISLPPVFFPDPMDWENYVEVWTENNFFRYTLNSLFLGVLEVAGTLISCAFVAFGLAFFQFRGRNIIFIAMLATLMLPRQVTIIPQFFIWKELGALDTYFPLIIPKFLGEAFGIFLMHQFFKSLPRELYEAATMDGANPFRIFYKIYLPLAKPALSALAVFAFMRLWNDTLEPLVYLTTKELYTLPLGLLFLQDALVQADTAVIMAGAFITAIPAILVFLVAQKHFIQGIASSGLKG